MKSREISRSKIGQFSLACTDPYIGIGWEYQSRPVIDCIRYFDYQMQYIVNLSKQACMEKWSV